MQTTGSKKRLPTAILASVLLAGCGDGAALGDMPDAGSRAGPAAQMDRTRLLIIGQDLGAIRGYMGSGCCPRPDALTAYLDFYDLLKAGDFGGLGIDASGDPAGFEFDWGAGPVSAYKTATEFGIDGLAIGLSITENEHPGKLARLIDGEFDPEIRQLARFFSTIPGPVYLRIGYEFDGAWNQGYENPQQFKNAWHRIVDVLRAERVSNVEYVWQSGAAVVDDVIEGRHEDIRAWYPGDDYVDWMAISWFMHPDETVQTDSPPYDPPTPRELGDEVMSYARERGKPVMIAEASPQAMDLLDRFLADHAPLWDGPPGGNRMPMTDEELWNHWFGPMFDYIDDNDDVVRALAYINADWDSQPMWGEPYASGFWGDSRLEVNDQIAAGFSAAIARWRARD